MLSKFAKRAWFCWCGMQPEHKTPPREASHRDSQLSKQPTMWSALLDSLKVRSRSTATILLDECDLGARKSRHNTNYSGPQLFRCLG